MIVFDVDETLVHGTTAIKDSIWKTVLFPSQIAKIRQVNRMFDRKEPFEDGLFRQGDRLDRIAYMLGLWDPDATSYRQDKQVLELTELFAEHVQKGILSKGIAESDKNALQVLSQDMGYSLYIVSNVPAGPLQSNIAYYGVADHFQRIIGTPTKKNEALLHIAQEHSCDPVNLLMVGDGSPDHDAAEMVGTQFVYVLQKTDTDVWPTETFPRIQSVSELVKLLT